MRRERGLDVVVVGAGIVGLAHATEAMRRGHRVTIVEQDEQVVGASIRNFGHACATAQRGVALDRAMRSRARWLELAEAVGFWVAEAGTVVLARAEDELDVLAEFADLRGDQVEVFGEARIRRIVPTTAPDVIGGAHFPLDLRVNPREACRAIGRWLAAQPGVTWMASTTCSRVRADGVETSRGVVRADLVVVAVNHDVDRLFPALAESAAIERCTLQMLRVTPPEKIRIRPGVLTGSSLLRYRGFEDCPSLGRVRARFERGHGEFIAADVNLMMTQLPDGDIILGDTHVRAREVGVFSREEWDELLVAEGARLLGASMLTVRERWLGVYATALDDFVIASPEPTVRVVSVTSGIGMSTAFGLAEDVLDGF